MAAGMYKGTKLGSLRWHVLARAEKGLELVGAPSCRDELVLTKPPNPPHPLYPSEYSASEPFWNVSRANCSKLSTNRNIISLYTLQHVA
jgi:hypothetical protein